MQNAVGCSVAPVKVVAVPKIATPVLGELPPLATKLCVLPVQIDAVEGVIESVVGTGFTVTVVVAVVLQPLFAPPLASVAVSV